MELNILYITFLFFGSFHTVVLLSQISIKTVNHNNNKKHRWMYDINTFAATYLNTQGVNNSCLKSPASTLVDLTCQSRSLRSFSLNQLRNLSL